MHATNPGSDVDTPLRSRELTDSPSETNAIAPLDPEQILVATARQTFVYERPDFSSPKLGYLESGTVIRRSAEPAGSGRCKNGFYRIEPDGYVCVGKTASLDADHPATLPGLREPMRAAPLPYVYARAGALPPHLYTRVPKVEERAALEPSAVTRSYAAWRRPDGTGPDAVDGKLAPEAPEFLLGHAPSLASDGERLSDLRLSMGRAAQNSSFGLVELFEAESEAWGLTTELLLLPLNQLDPIEPSRFRGVELNETVTLPLVFVRERRSKLYAGEPGASFRVERPIDYREAFSLSGRSRRLGEHRYLETKDGFWLRDSPRVTRVGGIDSAPHWARPGRTWLDVSLTAQTLVAYVGAQAVYATLVSSGKDRLGDPQTTHATVQGEFLIHTKHVTDAMSSDEVGDVYDHRDVPYVQFFKDGYALHAAYWHDAFGTPKSHGCINLSPEDARWLFEWTDPQVPEHWHGALSLLDGTLVSVHP